MTEGFVVSLTQEALFMAILISAPMLGIGLIVGLIISILQTTTSIQEQTLTFVPKIIAILLAVGFFGAWMLRMLMDYMIRLFDILPNLTV
ncbi:MAG: flagellar biosynthesis protein FliQ [bacterium]|nr:flagellar biosynthesis protein FliQ [bacterium]